MKNALFIGVLIATLCQIADAAEPAKLTIMVSGAHCENCVVALREAMSKIDGIKFEADQINRGEKPKWLSHAFRLEITDPEADSLGQVGKAVASARTPHRDDLPPSLYLVLYTPIGITEETVMSLRSELTQVSGVEVNAPGSLGGVPKELYYWVRINGDGNANLGDIMTAAKKGADVSLDKQ